MPTGAFLASRGRRDMSAKVKDALLALAICHNVRAGLSVQLRAIV